MNVMVESKRLPSVDVVVVGGGPAGIAAALAARRSGKRVMLVETQSVLGGTSTAGQVSHWLGGRTENGEWVVGGLFRELTEEAVSCGAALLPKKLRGRKYHPYAWLPWFIHGVVLDPLRLAWYLDRKLTEAGIEVLLETSVVGAEVGDGRIRSVLLHNKAGFSSCPASAFVDCSGDADLAASAGCRFLVGRDEDGLTAPASLTFHVRGIDHRQLASAIERGDPKFRPLIARLKAKGEWKYPYDIFISVKGLSDDEAMINTSRLTGLNPLSPHSRTAAYMRGRDEAFGLLEIFRRHFPGFKHARMASIAPMLGVRESRRIDGEFCLKVEDLRKDRDFRDVVGYSMYGWDLPDPKRPSVQPMVDESAGKFVNKIRKQLVTPIPFRALVPCPIGNLLCAGRCISVERDVLGPLRVMAPCMAMGEAAGIAAAMMTEGVANVALDVTMLRRELRRRGAIVDRAKLPTVTERVDP